MLQCLSGTFWKWHHEITASERIIDMWLVWLPSHLHCSDFDPMSIDVGKENLSPSLDDINQLVDALPTTLALPVCLVQEQRLEELLPQPHALQHWHCLLWKPECEECTVRPSLVSGSRVRGKAAPGWEQKKKNSLGSHWVKPDFIL